MFILYLATWLSSFNTAKTNSFISDFSLSDILTVMYLLVFALINSTPVLTSL